MNNKVLLENLRSIPDFPRKGINFRDVTTLYKNAECMQIMLDELYELYKDKPIFYGLGNFCFDRAGKWSTKWYEGLMVTLSFDENKVDYEIIPYHQCLESPKVELLEKGAWPDKDCSRGDICEYLLLRLSR